MFFFIINVVFYIHLILYTYALIPRGDGPIMGNIIFYLDNTYPECISPSYI